MAFTFTVSGLFHEYTIWVRTGSFTGTQIAFFMAQYVGIMVERIVGVNKSPVLGRVFLFFWLAVTLPWFLYGVDTPIEEFLNV